MADPVQSLDVVPRLYPLILSGEKTSTIRWREPRIVCGPMRYVCQGDASQTVVVNVFRVTDMALSQAAEFVGKADEWPDDVMLAGMREHYPDIELSDVVQVIEHSGPIG